MRFEALSQDTGWIALVSPERFGALLRKEKDGASLPSVSAGLVEYLPPFLVCEGWRFFAFRLRAGLATKTIPCIPRKPKERSVK